MKKYSPLLSLTTFLVTTALSADIGAAFALGVLMLVLAVAAESEK